MEFIKAIFSGDVGALRTILQKDDLAANKSISLPDNPALAHPLHRICDAVFDEAITEVQGIEMAKLFLEHGSNVNPGISDGQDSPLTAACSLRCDELALLYIASGANIHHRGCHGGTALHWAAWCGRDRVVRKIVSLQSEINLLCTEFRSTPLFWAVHGFKFGGENNLHNQVECAAILRAHGADPTIPNFEGYKPIQLLDEKDQAMKNVLK